MSTEVGIATGLAVLPARRCTMRALRLLLPSLLALASAVLSAHAQSADPTFPQTDGQVNALAIDGDTLYVGGLFSTIGGVPRRNLAAIDLTTGGVTAWDPSPNSIVYALLVHDGTLYVGGGFDVLAGAARVVAGAFDLPGGALNAWQPNVRRAALPNGLPGPRVIHSLGASGTTIYLGGVFNDVGGAMTEDVGAVDATTGAPLPWTPSAGHFALGNAVDAIVADSTMVALGGHFTQVANQVRMNLAFVDAVSAAATAAAPNPDGGVTAFALAGPTLYVGGVFAHTGGQPRRGLAAFAFPGGTFLPWTVDAKSIHALALNAEALIVGGDFDSVAGEPRSRLGAVDAATGSPLAWDPGANGTVLALASGRGRVFAGGTFTVAGGMAVHGLVSLPGASLVGVAPTRGEVANVVTLRNSAPHPARSGARLRFTLAHAARVWLELYDVDGRRVRVVCAGQGFEAGEQSVPLPEGLAPGMYFERLAVDGVEARGKLVVAR